MFIYSNFTFISILSYILLNLIYSFQLDLQIQQIPTSFNKNKNIKKHFNLRSLLSKPFQSYDDTYNIMSIPLCIGIPNQCLNLLYDTGSMYMVVGSSSPNSKFSKFYNSSKSQTFSSKVQGYVALTYRHGAIQAREIMDFVYLTEHKPKFTFNFLHAWNTTIQYNFDGILGLGFFYPARNNDNIFDERFSIIDYLKYNGIINHKRFGHEYLNQTYGKFYIDEIPNSMKNKNYYKCDVYPFIPYLSKWHCELRAISFSNGENFTLDYSPAAFDTAYIDIRGPFNEGKKIFNEILKQSKGMCQSETIEKNNQTYSKIICDEDISLSSFSDIYFNLKGKELTLFKDDLFRLVLINGKAKYVCKIVLDSTYNYWNLGEPVLKNYDLIFDYEGKTVGFQENINYYGESWLPVIILFILFVGIFSFGVWLYINRKKIFMKKIDNEQIEKLNSDVFDEGKQLGDIQEE